MAEIRCADLPEAIADLIGGEGSDHLRRAVERHAAGCAGCAELSQGLDEILARARAIEIPEPPESYWTAFRIELRERLAADAARPRRRFHLGALLRPAAATLALAALTAALVWSPAPATAPKTVDEDALATLIDDLDPLGGTSDSVFASLQLDSASQDWLDQSDLFGFLDAIDELDASQRQRLLDAIDEELPG